MLGLIRLDIKEFLSRPKTLEEGEKERKPQPRDVELMHVVRAVLRRNKFENAARDYEALSFSSHTFSSRSRTLMTCPMALDRF